MNRKIQFLKTALMAALLVVAHSACQESSSKLYETNAIAALDETTETIGNMNSCSLTISSTSQDGNTNTSATRVSDIYMRGSNKMHIYTESDTTRKGFWYNGQELAIFNFDNSTFDITPTPNTTIAMIDSLHRTFKIDFPAADVFYPTLTDDLINHFDSILYLGNREIDGTICKEVNAKNSTLNIYLLIDESTKLPKQLEIYGIGERDGESFVSEYYNWRTNPNLGDDIFNFSPPENSSQIKIFK